MQINLVLSFMKKKNRIMFLKKYMKYIANDTKRHLYIYLKHTDKQQLSLSLHAYQIKTSQLIFLIKMYISTIR